MKCTSCSVELLPSHRFCPSCGTPRDSISQGPTETASYAEGSAKPAGSSAPPPARVTPISPLPASDGGFSPGTVLADRYRIIALLGRGGMGEVYRADDLKLGQQVALKFLHKRLALDSARRERFYSEVRVARQVTHSNVCRVHDIVEAGDLHFLTMEFVDGEDLSSLLKRIGHLPGAKALDLARQICAGLAAAHDRGVLHRDLKPANVMIDGRGQVRITDFGLAVLVGERAQAEGVAGTPAYMAPEQFSGESASVRTDIYALGMVLYELFTGQRAFYAATIADSLSKKQTAAPTRPSEIVRDVDPDIECVILQCLESDPEQRPDSVARILAALPAGNRLEAALAAGVTPSPDAVAAAGEGIGIRPGMAVACLSGVVLGLILLAFLGARSNWAAQLMSENSPDALAVKARDTIKRLGYVDTQVESASGLAYDTDYLKYLEKSGNAGSRWNQLTRNRPSGVYFWYRQSPKSPARLIFASVIRVTENDPPQTTSGMVSIRLDPSGRLVSFSAVPPPLESSDGVLHRPDWGVLISAAGLDPARFKSADPIWTPSTAFDARAAWTGVFEDQADLPIRIEAAAYHGKPVYFETVAPWTAPDRATAGQSTPGQRILQVFFAVALLTFIFGVILLARYNLKRGRGDRRGAYRLAFFLMAVDLLRSLFGVNHTMTPGEVGLILIAGIVAMFWGVLYYLTYLALEPFVRRRWPTALISWNRILNGKMRDSLAGRDALVGILFGVGLMLLQNAASYALVRNGKVIGSQSSLDAWTRVRDFISIGLWGSLESAIMSAMFVLFLVLLLRVLTRRQWLAVAAYVSIFSIAGVLTVGGDPRYLLPYSALTFALCIAVLLRFGLVSLTALFLVQKLINAVPYNADFSAWYAGNVLFALITILALSGYAFHAALAGRPLLQGKLLES